MLGSMPVAVMASKAASPIRTGVREWRTCHAARKAISGPMPAGSPQVMAMTGCCFNEFNKTRSIQNAADRDRHM